MHSPREDVLKELRGTLLPPRPSSAGEGASSATIMNGMVFSPFMDAEGPDHRLAQLIRERLTKFSNKVVAVDGNSCLTGGDLLTRILQYAKGFPRPLLELGSRVCVHLENTVENLAATLALIFVGATMVPTRTSLRKRELQYHLEDSGCTHILTDTKNSLKVMEVAHQSRLSLTLFAIGKVRGFYDVTTFLNEPVAKYVDYWPLNTWEVFAIFYTSGCSDVPKGVHISHRAYVYAFYAFEMVTYCTSEDVCFVWSGFSHATAFAVSTFSILLGVKTVFMEPCLPLQELFDLLEVYRVTLLFGNPWKLQTAVSELKQSGRSVEKIKKICTFGSTLPKPLVADICTVLGCETLANIYCLSEVFGFVSSTIVGVIAGNHVGYLAPGCKIRIVDPKKGCMRGPGEVGEIWIRSNTLMKEYHERPLATEKALGGYDWLRTGDLGYYDEAGHLFFVERLRSMIKCMGNRFAPSEVEELLWEHEDLKEVAVVGVPNPLFGFAPTACVVLKESCVAPQDRVAEKLEEFVASRTTDVHKRLHGGVIFCLALPRCENGKVLRKDLLTY